MQTSTDASLADRPPLPGSEAPPVPLGYHDDPVPGVGRRRPRAQFSSDAARLSLNGDWAFTLADTAAGTGPGFADPDLDDGDWGRIDVPSHWVLRGHGDPLYTNTAFPFPITPPHTPTANPTGDYRRTFTLPAGWRREGAVLRFQGVDSCAAVWLNGVELGHSKGSRLPFEFDIGPALREGTNVLCVRVHRWSSGSYLEDQDMWWLPGIFRDVELLERPAAVDDVYVHADYDHRTGAGTLRVEATDVDGAPVLALVDVPELGVAALPAGTATTIDGVRPWSAEAPRLYRGTVHAGGERIELAIGFRTISVAEGVLRVNGVRVHLRGVNRHEHDPDHGRAVSVELMRRDILMMKAHNINAVRTSHYPPHPEFLRLCDELGLWVVDESDIETHGFIYAGWEGNPPDDPAWTPALLDRTARMVERDKNHPSVIIWSLGNESEGGAGFAAIEAWLRDRDPSRPLHYERDRTYAQSDFYSLMYPSLDDLAAIAERTEETPEALAENAELEHRRRALPFLLCEYAHAMGNGPGSLADYQEILESSDRMAGAFVWEWIDHGFRGRTPDGVEYLRHGGDIDYRPNGGSYCIDGLVRPDRVPSPGLLELAKVLEPVRFDVDADGITVRNHYDVLDTGHLAFTWELARDGVALAVGDMVVPVLAPGEQTRVELPEAVDLGAAGEGETWLTVSARLAQATPWAAAGHEVGWGQGQLAQHARPRTLSQKSTPGSDGSTVLSRAEPAASADPGTLAVGAAVLDTRTGDLISLGGLDVSGLRLDIWRAPTENDRGQGELNNLAKVWRAVGLDRMLHSVTDVLIGDGGACVRARLAPATQPFGLDIAYTWTAGSGPTAPPADDPGEVTLTVDVTPYGPWHDVPYGHHEVTLPRLGVRLGLPAAVARATWFGLGPGESYIDSLTAAKVGRYAQSVDDLGFEYLVPQETGNRHRARWLELTGADSPGLRVAGSPTFDFTARRWSTEALDAAKHPHDLHPEDRLYLHLDLAQHGLGSSSCGPATPDRYRVHPEPTRFALTFSTMFQPQKEQ